MSEVSATASAAYAAASVHTSTQAATRVLAETLELQEQMIAQLLESMNLGQNIDVMA